MYTALKSIAAPGTSVFGYRRGDEVHPGVVENWGLVVGDDGDVREGGLPDDDAPPVTPRPGPEATRADWEAYAVANGMSAEDAEMATQDDLEGTEPQPEPQESGEPERPADSAKKAEWVAYAKEMGADPEWAESDSTTKAELQAYQPGDTVALAATEANQA